MKLTAAYAVYNESRMIIRSLRSLYGWVDEIVIVDGESTDDTVSKIRKFDKDKKIRVITRENPPMFHINKQAAIDAAKGDWILQMDADELVSPELKDEILTVIHNGHRENVLSHNDKQHNGSSPGNHQHDGYWIPRLNYFLGSPLRKGGQYPDMTIRLYKNGAGRLPCKSVHEQAEIAGSIGTLKNDLLHYPYPDFREFVSKWIRYAALEAELNKALKPSLWTFIQYFIVKPKMWFLKTYFRHKGFMDGFPGFVFALFSSLRFCAEYIVRYELVSAEKQKSAIAEKNML